jgi:Carboxypeptidase regulatory-like domain
MRLACVLRALLVSVLFSAGVSAQSDVGTIGGFVRDPSGGMIPKAKVAVTNEATGEVHQSATNESGYYTITNLPPGFYSVTIEAPGFKKFDSTHNKLDRSQLGTRPGCRAHGWRGDGNGRGERHGTGSAKPTRRQSRTKSQGTR